MKTNQIMKRPMGNFNVLQRTKDGMFNATDLVKQWNDFVLNTQNVGYLNTPKKEYLESADNQVVVHTQNSGYVKTKDLDDYFNNKSTQEFIEALKREPEFLNGGNYPYLKSKARADRGGGTWMHPLMFIDFAMWLNPVFKVKVLKFVQDQMIFYRNEAGDAYRELSSAVQMLQGKENMHVRMKFVAKALNYLTFGHSEPAIRNSFGTEESQKQLLQRERHITSLIKERFITSYDKLQLYLRQCWVREKFV